MVDIAMNFCVRFTPLPNTMTNSQHDYVLSAKEKLAVYLSNDCRPDGREFDAIKPIVITPDSSPSSCFGSCMVKWGSTLVSCSITLQVGTPDPQHPTQGDIVFDAALWCTPPSDARQHRKAPAALHIENVLTQLYKRSGGTGGAIDREQLCIEAGKSAFRVCVQLACLSGGSSLLETCILAVSVALSRTVLPAVSMDSSLRLCVSSPVDSREELSARCSRASKSEEEEMAEQRGCKHSKALVVSRNFAGLSVGVVNTKAQTLTQKKHSMTSTGDKVFLFDPSEHEEEENGDAQLLDGRVLVVTDMQGNICLVDGQGASGGMDPGEYLGMCEAGAKKAREEVGSLLLPLIA